MSKQLTKIATVLALLAFVVAASCSKQNGSPANSNIDYWTCTMHPSVHAKDPGKCPICSMDLVPVMKDSGETKPSSAQTEQTKGSEMKGMAGMPRMPGRKGGAATKAPKSSES